MVIEESKSNNARRRGNLSRLWRHFYLRFYLAEKRWFEPAKERLDRVALLDILDRVGKAVILVSLVFYVGECGSRKEGAVFQAWQVIANASGKPGDLGRRRALSSLNKKGEDLSFLDLSTAHLSAIDLRGVNLIDVDLHEAVLRRVDLRGATLVESDLQQADLSGADLRRATLQHVDLRRADLQRADLSGMRVSSKNWFEDPRHLTEPPFANGAWQVETVLNEDGIEEFYIQLR